MRHFSAQYVYTNTGPPLRRPVISTHDDGTIISITDTGGNLPEKSTLAYYNGIIVPGFVNCHCHLELSNFRGLVEPSAGLPGFISSIRNLREKHQGNAVQDAFRYDSIMASGGIVACADICNGTDSFPAKEESSVDYLNLIEVFGINPAAAGRRFGESLAVAREAVSRSLKYNITPHSAYAISISLMDMIKNYSLGSPVSSIHFMESHDEAVLLGQQEGPMLESYREFGINPEWLSLPPSHIDAIKNHVTPAGNLILVHNTYTDAETVEAVNTRGSTFWCLCPNSNLYITGELPPVEMLRNKGCKIVTGTDSLASNSHLSILSELITLQNAFPNLPLDDLIMWGTLNGAEALGVSSWAGTIEPGKRPGLLLLEGADLSVPRLTTNTKVKRLI